MSQTFPHTIDFAGGELTVYPHQARSRQKLDAYGMRPVTTGGIVIGYFMKNAASGAYHGYGIDRKPLQIITGKQADCAKLIATKDEARLAYIEAAMEGAFGTVATQWVRAAINANFDGEQYFDADDIPHDVDVLWPAWNHGAPRAQVLLDNKVIGSVVQCFEIRSSGAAYFYYAQTPDSRQHGVSVGGYDSAVRCLVEHVLDQRQIEDSLAPSRCEGASRRDENVNQAWVAILCAISEQEAIDPEDGALDALWAAKSGLKAFAVLADVKLEEG